MEIDSRRALLEERIAILRRLERQAAAKDRPDVMLLAALRQLILEAEAESRG